MSQIDTYEELRKSGHSEEDAIKETKLFRGPFDSLELVTAKDLKISNFELKEELAVKFKEIDSKFHAIDLRFNKIDLKLNILMALIVVVIPFIKDIILFALDKVK